MTPVRFLIASAAAGLFPASAAAAELFGGLYVHDVDTPLSIAGVEGGADVQLGWRGGGIAGTPLQPYVLGALNTAGETHYAAAGLSMKFGGRLYVRPGLGLAVHSGDAAGFVDRSDDDLELGSRVLFAPELGLGARLTERLSIEASWLHMSHGTLFGRQNPGIDNFGVRLNFAL